MDVLACRKTPCFIILLNAEALLIVQQQITTNCDPKVAQPTRGEQAAHRGKFVIGHGVYETIDWEGLLSVPSAPNAPLSLGMIIRHENESTAGKESARRSNST